MPKELDEKLIKGKNCVYIGGEWRELETKEQKALRDTSKDVETTVSFLGNTFKAVAIPKRFKKAGHGYTITLNRGQKMRGTANFFLTK